jgi:IS5 family transposase
MIDTRHELVRLAALIDWSWFEEHWAGFFPVITHPPCAEAASLMQSGYAAGRAGAAEQGRAD